MKSKNLFVLGTLFSLIFTCIQGCGTNATGEDDSSSDSYSETSSNSEISNQGSDGTSSSSSSSSNSGPKELKDYISEEVQQNNKTRNLMEEFDIKENSANANATSLRSASKDADRASSTDIVVTENLGYDWNCYNYVLDLEYVFNIAIDYYSEAVVSVLQGETEIEYEIGQIPDETNPTTLYSYVTYYEEDEGSLRYEDDVVISFAGETTTYLSREDGFEIYVKYEGVEINSDYKRDLDESIIDEYYRVVTNGETLERVDCALMMKDPNYGDIIKYYYSMYRRGENEVIYLDYEVYLSKEIVASDTLTTIVYTDDLVIACDYETRPGMNFGQDSIDFFGTGEKVFWTIQMSDHRRGDIKTFPWAYWYTVSANLLGGWSSFIFDKNYRNTTLNGFLGWPVKAITMGEQEVAVDYRTASPEKFIPIASLGIYRDNIIYPGRLGFASYATNEDISILDCIDTAKQDLALESLISVEASELLGNMTFANMYDLQALNRISVMEELDNWIQNPISDVINPINRMHSVLKDLVEQGNEQD